MTALLAGRRASIGGGRAAHYTRHRLEQTLLHQIVEAHYSAFLAELAARDLVRRARAHSKLTEDQAVAVAQEQVRAVRRKS